MTFIIYRNKQTNQIEKYSVANYEAVELEKKIVLYNSETKNLSAEIVNDENYIRLIQIAEQNKKIKESNLKDIENSIENLRNDFYEIAKASK